MGNGTSIGRVRGLGSAHEGAHHWLVQRFTAIGNIVPQLHVHVVARRQGDDAWPAPIWGHGEPVPMHEDLRQSRIHVIQAGLEKEPE